MVAGLVVAGAAGAAHRPHAALGGHRRDAVHRAGRADARLARAARDRLAGRRPSRCKASDQVLRYSIDKATVELLYLPVPSDQTFRVKSFIDTVVYRVGDAAGRPRGSALRRGAGLAPVRDLVGDPGAASAAGCGRPASRGGSTSRTCARAFTSTASTPSAPRRRCSIAPPSELIAAQLSGNAERDPLRAQPVRDVARPRRAPGRARAAAARVAGGARSRRSRCWRRAGDPA